MSAETNPHNFEPPPKQAAALNGLVPYLQVDGASRAADLYIAAFGAKELFRYPNDEQGRTMHIHLDVNGSSLMLSDAFPDHGHPHKPAQGYTLQLILKQDEIDAWWERAIAAGLKVQMPLQEMFWGDRWGSLRDAFGVEWAMNAPVK